jgi:hypothetical protein
LLLEQTGISPITLLNQSAIFVGFVVGVLNVYVNYAIMAQLTGKEHICFFIVFPRVSTTGTYTPPCRLDIIFDLEAE